MYVARPCRSMPDDFIFQQFVFTDGVVVWRAWVLCREDYRKALTVPLLGLIIASSVSEVDLSIGVLLTDHSCRTRHYLYQSSLHWMQYSY